MEKKYSIGLFLTAIIAFAVIGAAYQINFEKTKERAEAEALQLEQQMEEENAIATEGQALKEDCYYLMEINGYVVVYLSDKETIYDYTDILVSELPYTLQNEIKNGKYIENTAELYGFLENYSS